MDLLFPTDEVQARVIQKQESQKRDRGVGRSLDLDFGDPIMVRNYAAGPKWVPAVVEDQTGPVSYKCSLMDGREVKRHQDQVISREVPRQEGTQSGLEINNTPPIIAPSVSSPPVLCEPSSAQAVGSSFNQSPVRESTEAVPSPIRRSIEKPPAELRRSARVRKPVDKLNL